MVTAHKYTCLHHGGEDKSIPLMDNVLDLVDDLLTLAYELDNGEGMNKGRFGQGPQVQWDAGNIRCVPDYARAHGMPSGRQCKGAKCKNKNCSTICRTCKEYICLGDCFEKHAKLMRKNKRDSLSTLLRALES